MTNPFPAALAAIRAVFAGLSLARLVEGALLVALLLLGLNRCTRPPSVVVDPLPARELLRLAQVRRADSAAAYAAGRLFQQRLDLTLIRKQDEAHDTLRPAGGPVLLPAFPAAR